MNVASSGYLETGSHWTDSTHFGRPMPSEVYVTTPAKDAPSAQQPVFI